MEQFFKLRTTKLLKLNNLFTHFRGLPSSTYTTPGQQTHSSSVPSNLSQRPVPTHFQQPQEDERADIFQICIRNTRKRGPYKNYHVSYDKKQCVEEVIHRPEYVDIATNLGSRSSLGSDTRSSQNVFGSGQSIRMQSSEDIKGSDESLGRPITGSGIIPSAQTVSDPQYQQNIPRQPTITGYMTYGPRQTPVTAKMPMTGSYNKKEILIAEALKQDINISPPQSTPSAYGGAGLAGLPQPQATGFVAPPQPQAAGFVAPPQPQPIGFPAAPHPQTTGFVGSPQQQTPGLAGVQQQQPSGTGVPQQQMQPRFTVPSHHQAPTSLSGVPQQQTPPSGARQQQTTPGFQQQTPPGFQQQTPPGFQQQTPPGFSNVPQQSSLVTTTAQQAQDPETGDLGKAIIQGAAKVSEESRQRPVFGPFLPSQDPR